MKFLIVDDSKAMRNIVQKIVCQAGYEDHEYQQAENGKQALEIIREWQPDMVFSDWHMPEMDGIELLKAISSEGLQTRVGMITTERSSEKVDLARSNGAQFVLNKPFTVEQLQDAVMPIFALDDDDLFGLPQEALKLPDDTEMEDLLRGLLADKVSVTAEPPCDLEKMPFVTGVFSNDKGQTKVICVLDMMAACYLGAALTKLPPHVALQPFKTRVIPKDLYNNAAEVLNVCSALFYDEATRQDLRCSAVHLITKPMPKLEALMQNKSAARINLLLETESYGNGRALIVAT